MSFSGEIKRELAGQIGKSRHCQLAELAAVISHAGKVKLRQGGMTLLLDTENVLLREKFCCLMQQLFGVDFSSRDAAEEAELSGEMVLKVLESVKMWDKRQGCFRSMTVVDPLLIQQTCCRRAFIRGAFLASGSMSDPNKGYHFEIVCDTLPQAKQLQHVMNSFFVDARIVTRKKNQVVYVKEGEHIVDLLNIMEAHVALMNLENVRIVKEMRNFVNRQVNCETANISKTVTAAVRHIEAIEYIRDKIGLESLPEHLQEIARLRLEYPDIPLKELGTYLNPPVGKSGVNHRLRKISEIAEELGMQHTETTSQDTETV